MPISYTINTPNIASETVDQETVIINFATGLYYHTDRAGSLIWQLLENGASLDIIVECLLISYSGDSTEITKAVSSFITTLECESLIVPLKEDAATPHCASTEQSTDRIPFSQPALTTYTDMAELLLLDPVHEVEDRGRHSVGNSIK